MIGLRWRTEKEVVSGKGQVGVNFSYFEAGENKQALVKLVTCERERSESGDGTDTGYGRSKKRKKERVASTSASDHKSKSDDDENFDEFLEGMFP
ncbi:unnamed protein product [Camellia sinensis]